jgi:hypothetical protein
LLYFAPHDDPRWAALADRFRAVAGEVVLR